MSHLRISSEFDGVREIDDNGVERTAQMIPFEVVSLLRGWQPICIRHKLVFKNREAYDKHWTPVCDKFDYRDCPPSDHKRHLKGYSNA